MRMLVVLPAARGVYPDEAAQRRIDRIRSYSRPGLEVEADYPAARSGFSPWGGADTAPGMARNHQIIAERMVQAEKEGYDAVSGFGMLDFGVEIARSLVNIPVIGQTQATYAMASMMAERIGVISYGSWTHSYHYRQMKDYGFLHLLVGLGAAEIPNNEMPKRREELYERFVSEGKRLVAAGAELIVCHGMSMSPIEYPASEFAAGIGVPVLDGLTCAIAMAQAWVSAGTPYSRARHPLHKDQGL
ncbi:MAG TPA: aspartate/glutamate racemase family protein [Chloroflexota bacterium]|nr:aspartate/glutamate racemase family protein [Chloroflexota bacterium]